jgi:polyhydroxybutyrate depolymerase
VKKIIFGLISFFIVLSVWKINSAEPAWGAFRRSAAERFEKQDSSSEGEHFVDSRGVRRFYYLHVPASYRADSPVSLILNFHGGGGSAKGHQKTSHMNEASDQFGFIVVYPAGTRPDGDTNPMRQFQRYWNVPAGPTGPFNTNTYVVAADEVDFMKAILADVKSKYNIDSKRIYATGLSNGAILAQYLGWAMSDDIAAIAPVAGPLWQDRSQVSLKNPISVMYFQGTADPCAPMAGGPSACEKGHASSGRIFPSSEQTLKIWREKLKCPEDGRVTYQNGEVTCTTWGPGEQGSEVVFCKIEGGGHTWPGGRPYSLPGLPIGKTTTDIDATSAMWEFFQKHPKST